MYTSSSLIRTPIQRPCKKDGLIRGGQRSVAFGESGLIRGGQRSVAFGESGLIRGGQRSVVRVAL
jgi:hypothetical protein